MTLALGGNNDGVRIPAKLRRPAVAVGVAVPVLALAAVGANAALDATSSPSTTTTTTSTDTSAGQSQDTHAIVVNHGDDRYRYALAFKIVQVSGDVVDAQNAAVAVAANCTDCTTVAVSFEGILVYGDPSVFTPENLALAFNDNCTNCATLAAAYQEEAQYSDRMRITGAGRQEIAAIRVDLESIRHDNLSLVEIDQRVNADAGRLLDVLRNDMTPVGKPTTSPSPSGSDSSNSTATGGATPTSTATPSPSDTTSPSGSSTSPADTASPSATST
jgi:putative peptide zinc metalloprotease protein